MPVRILFSSAPGDWELYRQHLVAAFSRAGIAAELMGDPVRPTDFDYIIWSPASPLQDFTPFTGLKAVLSLWAGVEKVVANKTLRVPVCRMVDPGLTAGMVEWVSGQVLRHHLGLDQHILHKDGVWRHHLIPPLAAGRHVGILGLGALGTACAKSLRRLGFQVSGWSRHQKKLRSVTCFAGESGLRSILARSEILVLLLPLTAATENLLNAERFSRMRAGAFLVNAGRGKLIDDDALIGALDAGQLTHATLDVFRQEPLPPDHAFWSHPKITVSPHVAAETRPETAVNVLVANIGRSLNGLALLNVVDLAEGY